MALTALNTQLHQLHLSEPKYLIKLQVSVSEAKEPDRVIPYQGGLLRANVIASVCARSVCG